MEYKKKKAAEKAAAEAAEAEEEKEVDMMICAFENLFMMLKAIYEGGLEPEFENGNTLIRWYSEEDKLYYTHPFDVDFSEHELDDIIKS